MFYFHDYLAGEQGNLQFQGLLLEAEEERRFHQLQAPVLPEKQPGLWARFEAWLDIGQQHHGPRRKPA